MDSGAETNATSQITPILFPAHVKKDIAFYHVPSKSLLEADLLFNLPAKEQVRLKLQTPRDTR